MPLPAFIRDRRVLAGLVLAGSATLSYAVFRERPLDLSVRLAPLAYRSDVPQSTTVESTVLPLRSVPAIAKSGGKVEVLNAKSGDLVQTGQLLAVLNAAAARARLEGALAKFKATPDQQARVEVAAAKRNLEESIVRAPESGYLWLTTSAGASLPGGNPIGAIEDHTKLMLPVTLPEAVFLRLATQTGLAVSVAPKSGAPFAVICDVRLATAKSEAPEAGKALSLVMPADASLLAQLHQPVRVTLPMLPLKNVALIGKGDVVTAGGESKILVLSPYGTLHWQRVTGAPVVDDKIAVPGADQKTFRVVVPGDLDLMNKAITLNAKRKLKAGG